MRRIPLEGKIFGMWEVLVTTVGVKSVREYI